MFELKPLSREALRRPSKGPRGTELKRPARRSIARRPAVNPDNQQALVILLLALTGRFGRLCHRSDTVEEVLTRLIDPYEQSTTTG
jgi:hypothetical protein